jgi:hypothetical protein
VALRWAVAPLMLSLVLVLLWTSVPLRARWRLSEGAFEDVVAQIEAHPENVRTASGDIGLYTIISVEVVEGGILFTDSEGSGSDDAGFAYLPDGPHDGLENGGFEAPCFVHLDGPWYAWTASW